MKRSIFALSLLAGFAVAAERPNIVLIVTDDQSWDSLGFTGDKVHSLFD
jgi:hypothetical protein